MANTTNLVFCLFFLLIFSTCLLLFILLRRIVVQHQEKQFQKRYEEIEKDIIDLLTSESPELVSLDNPKFKSHPNVLVQVLIDYMKTIKGSENKQLKIIFDRFLRDKWIKNLHAKGVIKRLKAARLFTLFADSSETKYLASLLKDKAIIRLTALDALSQISSPEALAFIFQALEKDSDQNVEAYFNILYVQGDKIEAFLKTYLRKPLSVKKLGLLIELVGYISLPSLYPEVVYYTSHSEKEIRIRVARALGNLAVPDSINTLIQLATDQEYGVKAQAIKSLGKIRALEALDILTSALFSPSWEVRLCAGYGLRNMGPLGIHSLEKIARAREDRYATDMANMVLSDIAYSEELQ